LYACFATNSQSSSDSDPPNAVASLDFSHLTVIILASNAFDSPTPTIMYTQPMKMG
jgi:hypothetical protein